MELRRRCQPAEAGGDWEKFGRGSEDVGAGRPEPQRGSEEVGEEDALAGDPGVRETAREVRRQLAGQPAQQHRRVARVAPQRAAQPALAPEQRALQRRLWGGRPCRRAVAAGCQVDGVHRDLWEGRAGQGEQGGQLGSWAWAAATPLGWLVEPRRGSLSGKALAGWEGKAEAPATSSLR